MKIKESERKTFEASYKSAIVATPQEFSAFFELPEEKDCMANVWEGNTEQGDFFVIVEPSQWVILTTSPFLPITIANRLEEFRGAPVKSITYPAGSIAENAYLQSLSND